MEKDYLESLYNCQIKVFAADDEGRNDPENKSRFASPLKPAIYIHE